MLADVELVHHRVQTLDDLAGTAFDLVQYGQALLLVLFKGRYAIALLVEALHLCMNELQHFGQVRDHITELLLVFGYLQLFLVKLDLQYFIQSLLVLCLHLVVFELGYSLLFNFYFLHDFGFFLLVLRPHALQFLFQVHRLLLFLDQLLRNLLVLDLQDRELVAVHCSLFLARICLGALLSALDVNDTEVIWVAAATLVLALAGTASALRRCLHVAVILAIFDLLEVVRRFVFVLKIPERFWLCVLVLQDVFRPLSGFWLWLAAGLLV